MVIAIVFFMSAWLWRSSALVTIPLALAFLAYTVWDFRWAFDFPLSDWDLDITARVAGTGLVPFTATVIALVIPRRARPNAEQPTMRR